MVAPAGIPGPFIYIPARTAFVPLTAPAGVYIDTLEIVELPLVVVPVIWMTGMI